MFKFFRKRAALERLAQEIQELPESPIARMRWQACQRSLETLSAKIAIRQNGQRVLARSLAIEGVEQVSPNQEVFLIGEPRIAQFGQLKRTGQTWWSSP